MLNHAVLQRELRRLLRSPVSWLLIVFASLGLASTEPEPGARVGFLITVALCLSMYWAHRSMMAELEEDTIEQLGTLPMSPRSITFQMGTGAGLAALAYSFVALLILSTRDPLTTTALWLRFSPVVLIAGWMGALGAFRFGDSWLTSWTLMAPMTFVLCVGLGLTIAALAIPPLPLAMAASLVLGFCVYAASLQFWHLIGGQWVESLIPVPRPRAAPPVAPDGTPAAPPPIGTCVPDGVSPLFWYDWKHERTSTFFMALVPCLLLVLMAGCADHANLSWMQEIVLGPALFFGTIIIALIVSGRTAMLRRAGLWSDIAVTPLSTRSVVLSQVGAPLVRSYLCLLSWMFAAYLLAGGRTPDGIGWMLAGVMTLWAMSAFTGFLAGSVTSGWKAGLIALAMVYLIGLGLAMCIPPALRLGPAYAPLSALCQLGLTIGLVFAALYGLCVLRVRSIQA